MLVVRISPKENFPTKTRVLVKVWLHGSSKIDLLKKSTLYVFGITHVPRLEDWSVMPVERIGFMLQAHGFFNCSHAVDVPPSPRACESDVKEGHVKETIATKSVSNGLIAML
ncbi:unnamed protein product [Lactuca saligna]|uniref:Amine oxidase n=1 Tax=Lactuca saligna TaxID=75948 RepID=A0AA35YZJ3_LACSI|nr:unnamed protein product [Lactuca saligna]